MKFNSNPSTGGNPHRLKMKSGDSVVGVLRGNPFEYEHAFKPGDTPKFRFQINIVIAENGAMVAKVLEGPGQLYKQIKDLLEAGWDLEKSYVKISREGSGQNDTRWSATALPKPVPADTLAKLDAIQLRELSAPTVRQDAPEPGSDAGDPGPSDSDLPF